MFEAVVRRLRLPFSLLLGMELLCSLYGGLRVCACRSEFVTVVMSVADSAGVFGLGGCLFMSLYCRLILMWVSPGVV